MNLNMQNLTINLLVLSGNGWVALGKLITVKLLFIWP